MKIAFLNMKGGGLITTSNKWSKINQLIINKRVDIMILQEMHLTEDKQKHLNEVYNRGMHILSSIDERMPNKIGITVILNKRTTH